MYSSCVYSSIEEILNESTDLLFTGLNYIFVDIYAFIKIHRTRNMQKYNIINNK